MEVHLVKNSEFTLAYGFDRDFTSQLKQGTSKKVLEQEAVRSLLHTLEIQQPEVGHHPNGAPFLHSHPEKYVSISHSKGWVAVMLSNRPVGVDIEVKNEHLIAGQDYFINVNEQAFSQDLKALQLIWCAKEAYYKYCQGNINDLKEEVSIVTFHSNQTLLLHHGNKTHLLNYQLVAPEVYLVYIG